MTRQQAKAALEDVGLELGRETEGYSSVDIGLVCDQSQEPYSTVKSGSSVDIVISVGIEKVEVPGVEGRSLGEAQSMIVAAGLYYSIQYEQNDSVAENVVLRQSITPGASVERGTTVTIFVSRGSGSSQPATEPETPAQTEPVTEPETPAQTEPETPAQTEPETEPQPTEPQTTAPETTQPDENEGS